MAEIERLLGSLEPLVREYGAAVVMVILTFESFGLPLPGESLLVFASVLAGRGDLSFPFLLVSAWVGAVLGDNIGYVLGKLFGRHLALRYGGVIGLNASRLGKIEALFARYGPVTVCLARFFNVLRQLNGIVAGTMGMDWRKFLAFNALGGALWVLAWSLAGFYLGVHVSGITSLAHRLERVGLSWLWRHSSLPSPMRSIAHDAAASALIEKIDQDPRAQPSGPINVDAENIHARESKGRRSQRRQRARRPQLYGRTAR